MENLEFTGMAKKKGEGSLGLAESEKSKENIYESSENLANYISQEGVKNVFFLDNSARQAYVGLKEIWKKEHASEEEPGIYFINPEPLKYAQDFDELAEEFAKKFHYVEKHEKLLIYDVCVHTANTILNTQEFFNKMGFTDVKIAITSVSEDCSLENKAKIDLICLNDRAKAGCQPYGKPSYIQKSGAMISNVSINEKSRHQGTVDHQKIKDVFK